jgi:hypothetical protein
LAGFVHHSGLDADPGSPDAAGALLSQLGDVLGSNTMWTEMREVVESMLASRRRSSGEMKDSLASLKVEHAKLTGKYRSAYDQVVGAINLGPDSAGVSEDNINRLLYARET